MERIPTGENINSPLMERVIEMKAIITDREDPDLVLKLAEETIAFDKELNKVLDKYDIDPLVKEGIPEWHKLVGGTPEYGHVDAAARVVILEQIEQFVDEFTAKYLEEA